MRKNRYRQQLVLAVAADLRPFGARARTHSSEQIAAIARSIERFGFNNPVLLDERGLVLCGWGRVLAACSIGFAEVPTLRIAHLSADEKRAYVLADNKLALLAGWDDDLLKIEFEELAAAGLDLTLTGFETAEIDALLLPNKGRGDPDAAPPLPKKPVARRGEVWLLGRHRLICGDATSADDAKRVLAGAKPHLMVTDPPYGVAYDPAWRKRVGLSSEGAAVGKVANDDIADWRAAWAHFPGSVAYVWHGALHCSAVQASLAAKGLRLRAQIVWVKQRPVVSRGHYHWQHEASLYVTRDKADDHWRHDQLLAEYAVAEGETAQWAGDRKQSTVWFIDHLANDTGHGTQKPVECMRRPMLNNSVAGDAVYEPFSGSGTTIIAAEMAGRTCHAVEIDPGYVDVAVERWQEFTGQKARREGRKRTS